MRVTWTVFVTLAFYNDLVAGSFIIPELSQKTVADVGDINIGVLMSMSVSSDKLLCSNKLKDLGTYISTVAIDLGVYLMNTNAPLPNGLKLGYVILDDCQKSRAATVQSLNFVRNITCSASPNPPPGATKEHDVVAVIGVSSSQGTAFVASLLGASSIPLIGIRATSDAFGDREEYPYYMSIVPSDAEHLQAARVVIRQFNWNYISVVHQNDSIGSRTLSITKRMFDDDNVMCLASVKEIQSNMNNDTARKVARDLGLSQARVVLLIVSPDNVRILIGQAYELGLLRTHVWLVIELWEQWINGVNHLDERFIGTLFLRPSTPQPSYSVLDYMNNATIKMKMRTINDWYKEADDDYLSKSAYQGAYHDHKSTYDGHILNAISMINNATSRVLNSSDCSALTGAAARDCVTGPRLLGELRSKLESCKANYLDWDDEQRTSFVVKQVAKSRSRGKVAFVDVALVDIVSNESYPTSNNVSWAHLTGIVGTPKSVCSEPCQQGTAKLVLGVHCCWLCVHCKVNEKITSTNGCVRCPRLYWPESTAGNTTCAKIEPVHSHWTTKIWIVNILTTVIGLVLCLVTAISYWKLRKKNIIHSLALSFLALFGIALGFIALVVDLVDLTEGSCRLSNVLVSLSFTALYGSLFVRCVCIYRIFDAFLKQAPPPRFTDGRHKMLGALGLLLVQAVISSVVLAGNWEWYGLQQNSPTKKQVEMTCTTPTAGYVTLILPSLLLLLLCTGLSFPVRHLSDNFMEAGFIFKFCCASLVVWLCCIPTYFLFIKISMVKITIWALLIGLNHLAALAFVFATRIYAAVFNLTDTDEISSTESAVLTQPGAAASALHDSPSVGYTDTEGKSGVENVDGN